MVGKTCSVCRNSSIVNKHLSFFTYPFDQQRRYEWLKAVDRLDLVEKLESTKARGNHRICEAHFHDDFIKKTNTATKGRKCLTKDAFPSLTPVNRAVLALECNGDQSDSDAKRSRRKIKHLRTEQSSENLECVDVMEFCQPVLDDGSEDINSESNTEVMSADQIKSECRDVDVQNPSTPPSVYHDMSQFCESVMRVSREAQTTSTGDIEDAKKNKRRKVEMETNDSFLLCCSKFLPKTMMQLIKWQLDLKDNVDNYKFDLFALNLYFSGANSYGLLKSMLSLPEVDVLKKMLIPHSTKLNNTLINALKIKVCNMSPKERICCVSIGTMPLKTSLYYNITYDKVEGLHEVDGVQKLKPAQYVLVAMVQGIVEAWAQPVAYAFIAQHEISPDISMWIEEIFTLLMDIGLDVRAFVSDPKTELLYMSESQRVTPEKTYFSMNGKNIYYIFDTTHLQDNVKDCLEKCHFYSPSIDNCDNSVFYKKLDHVCNILNSKTQRTLSFYKNPFSNIESEMLALFQDLKVIRKADGVDVTNDIKFIDSFRITIASTMQLFNDLGAEGVKKLLKNRLTQNHLRKFFSRAKGKRGCTVRQFKKSFARCFVFNLLKKPIGHDKSINKKPAKHPQMLSKPSKGETANQAIVISTTDYRKALPEKGIFEIVCRYLYLKCIEKHSCNEFSEFLSRSQGSREYAAPYRFTMPLDVRNCKIMPPKHFTNFIMILERRFKDYYKQDVKLNGFGGHLMRKIASFEFETPCKCFPIVYLKKLFVRLRIYYAIRENNLAFKEKASNVFNTFDLKQT